MSQRSAVTAWEALFRAQVAVMRYLTAEFPANDISFNEYDVMFNLSLQPGHSLRLKELNDHVLLTQPSISRLVDRLVSRKLVTKTPDATDGRGTIVSLTDEGFDVFRKIARVHSRSITERVGGNLDADELAELTRLSEKLRGNKK